MGWALVLRALAKSAALSPTEASLWKARAGTAGVLAHAEDGADVHMRFRLPLLEDPMARLLQPSCV